MSRVLPFVIGAVLLAVRPAMAQDSSDPVKRGQYLVTIGGCNDCHTPLKMGPKGPEPTRYGDWERKGLAVDF